MPHWINCIICLSQEWHWFTDFTVHVHEFLKVFLFRITYKFYLATAPRPKDSQLLHIHCTLQHVMLLYGCTVNFSMFTTKFKISVYNMKCQFQFLTLSTSVSEYENTRSSLNKYQYRVNLKQREQYYTWWSKWVLIL